MAINCSSNAALDKLQASKDAMQAKLDALTSAGASALADVKAQADAIKADLLAALPEIPEFPNFKKELDALKGKVGAELTRAKTAFRERWGDALPDVDVDGLMDKVSAAASLVNNFEEDLNDFVTGVASNVAGAAASGVSNLAGAAADKFDFCKDVPNIDAPEVVDGKVTKVVEKAVEPTTPDNNAKQSEAIVPTIVETENQIVEGFGKSAKQIAGDYKLYKRGAWVDVVYEPYTTNIISGGYMSGGFNEISPSTSINLGKNTTELVELRNKHNKKLKKMYKEMKKAGYTSSAKYFNDGEMKSKYHSDFISWAEALYDSKQLTQHSVLSDTTRRYFEKIVTGEVVVGDPYISDMVIGPEAEAHIKGLFTSTQWWKIEGGVAKWIKFPEPKDGLFEKIKTHVNDNSQVILDYYNYMNGITPA